MTIKVTLNAGHRMNYHSHQHRDEVWTVIAGEGKTEKKNRTEVYNTLRKGDYLEAAELLNNFTNNALMGDVEKEFKESRMTAPGHNYISLLKNNGVKRYITTNYDSVIEKNYAANGDKLQVVIPGKTTKNTFRSYNRKETPYVIKLHAVVRGK